MSLTTTTYVLSATPTRIDFGTAQAIMVENLGADSVWYARFTPMGIGQNEGSLNLGDVKQYFTGPQYFAASKSSATIQVTFIPSDAAVDPTSIVSVSSTGGGQAVNPTILLDAYYDSAAYTHKTDAINAAVAAAQALAGTLELRQNRVYSLDNGTLSVAPGSLLRIKGNKATLQANWGKPRCVDFTRTADYQTFQFEAEDLTFDANNLTAGANQSVVGNLIDGGGVNAQRINATYVRIRRCQWINVPTGTSSGVAYACFNLMSRHLAAGETQTNLTDIRLEDCKMRGGNIGAAVFGQSGGTTCEVYHDKIYLDVDHDTGVVPSSSVATTSWANAQIGGVGWGDNCEVHVKGANSGDVGVEIDGMQNSDVYGQVTDARNAAFFFRNFHAPPRPNAQVAKCNGCYHRVVNLNPDNTYNAAGFQLSHTITPNPVFGTLILDKCTSDSLAANAAGRAIYVGGPAYKLVTNECKVNQDSINHSLSVNQTLTPVYLNPAATDSNSTAAPFTWVNRGGEVNVAGTITLNGHTFNYNAAWADLPSASDITFDGATPMAFATNITATGLTAGSCKHVVVGPSAAPATKPLVRGLFSFRIKSFAGSDTGPYGAFVQDWQGAATPFINLDADLTFANCDARQLPAGSAGREVWAQTQAQGNSNGQFRVLYPGLRIQGNAPAQVQQEASGLVTSPYTFTNRDGRRKMVWLTASTQSITAVAFMRQTNQTLSTVLSLTSAGPFYLDSHDSVQWTFAANPTITLKSLVAET